MLGSPRLLFAFGRDGILPGLFASVHTRFHTPHVAIGAHAALACALSFVGSFGQLVLLSNVAVLLLYLLCSVSAFVLARRDIRPEAGTAFTFPGQRVVPVLACLVVAWVLSNATLEELAVTALAAGGATVLYVLRWAQRRRGGPERSA
jgi:amino acid transporter